MTCGYRGNYVSDPQLGQNYHNWRTVKMVRGITEPGIFTGLWQVTQQRFRQKYRKLFRAVRAKLPEQDAGRSEWTTANPQLRQNYRNWQAVKPVRRLLIPSILRTVLAVNPRRHSSRQKP